jgi:predicted O-methyltransferase YrrM
MGKRSQMPDAVEQYVFELMCREIPAAKSLRDETARLPEAGMQIGPDQAAFMAMLVRLSGTRRALEIGTFTGYSALSVASALPEDGRLLCCDVSEEWTSIARSYWKQAGVDGKIQLRLGPAIESLQTLLKERAAETFDFAFIDADKPNYDAYYELCLQLVRPGGLILLDNMLWHGKVADPAVDDEQTVAFRALNEKICKDDRVEATMLTIGDGIMLARKRNSREG